MGIVFYKASVVAPATITIVEPLGHAERLGMRVGDEFTLHVDGATASLFRPGGSSGDDADKAKEESVTVKMLGVGPRATAASTTTPSGASGSALPLLMSMLLEASRRHGSGKQ